MIDEENYRELICEISCEYDCADETYRDKIVKCLSYFYTRINLFVYIILYFYIYDKIAQILVLNNQKKLCDELLEKIISNECLHSCDYKNIIENISKAQFKSIEAFDNTPIINKEKEKKFNLNKDELYSIEPSITGNNFLYRVTPSMNIIMII